MTHPAGPGNDGVFPPEFLNRNRDAYETMRDLVGRPGGWNAETRAVLAGQVADFAYNHHPGRFADGALEDVLLDIGANLTRVPDRGWKHLIRTRGHDRARRQVLHIATSVQSVGGHTRTIKNWINSDPDSTHWILLTRQGKYRVPHWIAETARTTGGDLIALPDRASTLTRAMATRVFARSAIDLVVLHTYGYDPIPLLAFAVPDGPPVLLLDHTDHLFWMGNAIADLVVHQRNLGQTLAAERRFPRASTVLPIPLIEGPSRPSRAEARDRLGIPRGQSVLLTVGRPIKYLPIPSHNVVRTARRILNHNPSAHLYLVGVTEADLVGCPDVEGHPRLHFLGEIEDPSWYQAAADVYLEGFPFGSQTALLEAAFAGVPVVRAFAPPLDLLTTDDEVLDGLSPVPASEDEYVDTVEAFIRSPSSGRELGGYLRDRVYRIHLGPEWQHRLHALYDATSRLTHGVARIPVTDCVSTKRDVALSAFQALRNRRAAGVQMPADPVTMSLLAGSYHARSLGQFRGSFNLLRECARRCGWTGRVRRELVKLGIHGLLRAVKGP